MNNYRVQVANEDGGITEYAYGHVSNGVTMLRLKDIKPSPEYTSLFVVDGAVANERMDIAFDVADVAMLILQEGMIRIVLKSNGYLSIYEKDQTNPAYWANALAEVLKLC